ncbi:hypothetical protein BP5796_10725 [Coleophoma crateriformis]|uniref:WW domain-containing protein n=1 Tax=Coleophoma crateriformis TaxID=565419 RepID=A0A3D8QQY3_9HELO|nr:hypothetical protein BP5796_10725 [Coleophoma crateriformis]
MASSSSTDAPPSYETAIAPPSQGNAIPKIRNGIPHQTRRSMEDESRPLPEGWVRSYDPDSHHQFFVDTRRDPPASIWEHPYDNEAYLSSLSPEERAHIKGIHRVPSERDVEAESSDDENHAADGRHPPLPPRSKEEPLGGVHKLGRRMKDKLTNSTHQEREVKREERAKEEQATYERHQKIRAAMSRAMETGEPQLLGKDKNGRDLYIEPPPGIGSGNRAYNGGVGYSPYNNGRYGYNSTYVRPQYPYHRPNRYGYGYGAGYGLPLGLGVGALGGGLLLGGMGGGFGGGMGGGFGC